MFVLCPHCQFLVANDPASQRPPAACPRCHAPLQASTQAQPDASASMPIAAAEAAREVVSASAHADADATLEPVDVESAAKATADASADTPIESSDALPDPETSAEAVVAGIDDAADIELDPQPPQPIEAGDAVPALAGALPLAIPAPAIEASAPQFVQRQQVERVRSARGGGRLWWVVASMGLLLGLQLLLADRARLARDPQWRPALLQLCGLLSCSLPPWHEPAAFTVLDRDVRPVRPGVLHVTATFRNDARWAQPWPSLLLTLADVDGRSSGARVFAPRDYLGMAPKRPLLASGESVQLTMDVVEPRRPVVAFTFDFR